ncbi:hypothetical protein ID866_10331 [Astraeus odoratus]|nr:hypothetical protein ID866_10331 [Astraeus odoratus]
MSSNTNLNNNSGSASILSIVSDWMTIPDAQLNWDDNDMDEIATAKFQESNGHEEEPAVEIVGGSSKQVTLPWGGKKKKRVRKLTMADDKVVVEGQEMGQLEARGSDTVAEAICKLLRELTGQLDTLTSHILKELQGQMDVLESLVKTQQLISQKMTWHYAILEDMLGELEVFATNPGEPPEEEDMVEEEELEEARGKLEGLGSIVDMEQEMEGEQQGKNQDKGKGKERVEQPETELENNQRHRKTREN